MVTMMHTVDLEPIERLAEKVKGLVDLLENTRSELEQTVDDNQRLKHEVESLSERLASVENEGAEMKTLVTEREQIRTRVYEMLEQLEGLNL